MVQKQGNSSRRLINSIYFWNASGILLLYLVLILFNFFCPKAWHLCDPEAERVFMSLRKAGVKLAVVSNFDTRLRPVLQALNCNHWFDAVAVSAEVSDFFLPQFLQWWIHDSVSLKWAIISYLFCCCLKMLVPLSLGKQVEAEKPNPTIFLKACELLGVKPEEVVHVGDDRRNDIWGARDAGCDAWLWGSDVYSFKEVLMIHTSFLAKELSHMHVLVDLFKQLKAWSDCVLAILSRAQTWYEHSYSTMFMIEHNECCFNKRISGVKNL